MKILQLKDITRKDVPIYYRRHYSGIAVLELLNKSIERRIDFMIETKPTGVKEISISISEPVDYPLTPLIKELKQFVIKLDDSGGLPG
ncbi:MAG: hypothetical protein LBC60_08065 [Spirochaetaceae bacterium]|jgi:hypothetical protein|nr:hypothetical protein [Spirochaetaceae bacterium]